MLLFKEGKFLLNGPAVILELEPLVLFINELIIKRIRLIVKLLDLGLELAVFKDDQINLIFESGDFIIDPVVVNGFRVEKEFGEQDGKGVVGVIWEVDEEVFNELLLIFKCNFVVLKVEFSFL